MLVSSALVLLVGGPMRLWALSRRRPAPSPVTTAYVLALAASILSLLVASLQGVYLGVRGYQGQMSWAMGELAVAATSALLWTLALAVLHKEHRTGAQMGAALVAFAATQSIYSGLRLEATLSTRTGERLLVGQVLDGLELALSLALSLLALVTNEPPTQADADSRLVSKGTAPESMPLVALGSVPTGPPSQEAGAGPLSRLTYWWLTPLLQRGYEQALEQADLPPLPAEEAASGVAQQFQGHWAKEISGRGPPSLLRAIWRTVRGPFIAAGFLKLFGNDALVFAGPVLLARIVAFLATPEAPLWEGLLYAGAMLFSAVVQSLSINKYFHLVFRVNMRVKAATVGTVYGKALRLSHAARQGSTVGEIVNLQSLDANRLGETVRPGLPSAPPSPPSGDLPSQPVVGPPPNRGGSHPPLPAAGLGGLCWARGHDRSYPPPGRLFPPHVLILTPSRSTLVVS